MKSQNFHLVTHVLCPYVQRSVITLKEKSLPYQRTDIDFDNKPDWFDEVSPLGKVPVLLVDGKRSLFESAVICEYLNEITPGSLHPKDSLEKACHRSWIAFGSEILDTIGSLYSASSKKCFETHRLHIRKKFQQLEKIVDARPYFSGNQFQLIDAVYGPIFRYFDVFEGFVDLQIFNNLNKIKTWRQALQNRESIQQAVIPQYPELLLEFLKERNSYLSGLI